MISVRACPPCARTAALKRTASPAMGKRALSEPHAGLSAAPQAAARGPHTCRSEPLRSPAARLSGLSSLCPLGIPHSSAKCEVRSAHTALSPLHGRPLCPRWPLCPRSVLSPFKTQLSSTSPLSESPPCPVVADPFCPCHHRDGAVTVVIIGFFGHVIWTICLAFIFAALWT